MPSHPLAVSWLACILGIACSPRKPADRLFEAGGDGVSHARFPSSKLKLDELFLHWLSLPESQSLVRHIAWFALDFQKAARLKVNPHHVRQVLSLLEDAKAGRPLAGTLCQGVYNLGGRTSQRRLCISVPSILHCFQIMSSFPASASCDGFTPALVVFTTPLVAGPLPQHSASSPLSPSSAQALFAASNTARPVAVGMRQTRSKRQRTVLTALPLARSRHCRRRRGLVHPRRLFLRRGGTTRGQTLASQGLARRLSSRLFTTHR